MQFNFKFSCINYTICVLLIFNGIHIVGDCRVCIHQKDRCVKTILTLLYPISLEDLQSMLYRFDLPSCGCLSVQNADYFIATACSVSIVNQVYNFDPYQCTSSALFQRCINVSQSIYLKPQTL